MIWFKNTKCKYLKTGFADIYKKSLFGYQKKIET